MTPIFFHHILAIELFQISQDKKEIGKRVISSICGFFQYFLALFDTLTTRYDHSHIKFEFSWLFLSL